MSDPSRDPNAPEPQKKRMLPSVSDVVRELASDSAADAGLIFKAARQVCAEELNRISGIEWPNGRARGPRAQAPG